MDMVGWSTLPIPAATRETFGKILVSNTQWSSPIEEDEREMCLVME